MLGRWFLGGVVALGSLAPAAARAELPADCADLGPALVEHSCFHSIYGPFVSLAADAGDAWDAETPNVDAVHTEYRLSLPAGVSVVSYEPTRSGSYAIFLGRPHSLEVRTDEGAPVAVELETTTTGCSGLPLARVVTLSERERYGLVFDSPEARELVVVLEYLDDFLTSYGPDSDGDGFGRDEETIVSNCAPPPGYAPNASDCDDTNPEIHPAALEVCGDAVDQNCNGSLDDVGLACREGLGACAAEGVRSCAGSVSVCAALVGTPIPETCNGVDDDCDGTIDEDDDAPLCSREEAPTCVRSAYAATCGCAFDADCRASEAPVCDPVKRSCVAKEMSEPPRADEGGGGSASQEPPAAVEDGGVSGCSCRVGPPRDGPKRYLPFVAVALMGLIRRRPQVTRAVRKLAQFLGLSLLGCGGLVDAPEVNPLPETPGDDGHDHSGHSHSHDPCSDTVSADLVNHVCAHMTNGPFEYVLLGTPSLPSVSQVHTTFEMSGPDSHGAVEYVAERPGARILFSSAPLRIRVIDEVGALVSTKRLASSGCSRVEQALLFEPPETGAVRIEFADLPDKASVFLEQVGAFGTASIARVCDE